MRDDGGRAGRSCALAGAAALLLGAVGTAEAAVYQIDVERLFLNEFDAEDEQLTFSGGGSVTIDASAGGQADIEALSLSVQTLAEIDGEDAVLTFDFGLDDLVSASGLDGPLSADLSGLVIGLGDKASEGGEAVFLGTGGPAALTLDFGAGLASTFCVGSSDDALVQCIRGGGSSSGLEAGLSAAVIPVPAALPLALTGLGGLALWRLGRRAA